jgi:hypothetical protein
MSLLPDILKQKHKIKKLGNLPRDIFDSAVYTSTNTPAKILIPEQYNGVGADCVVVNKSGASLTVTFDKTKNLTLADQEVGSIDNTLWAWLEIPAISAGTVEVTFAGWSFDLIANL